MVKKKDKTFVITVSRNFMKAHPRSGEPTDFKLGIQKANVSNYGMFLSIDRRDIVGEELETFAKNDGVSLRDFQDWMVKDIWGGCIIHFTDLRY